MLAQGAAPFRICRFCFFVLLLSFVFVPRNLSLSSPDCSVSHWTYPPRKGYANTTRLQIIEWEGGRTRRRNCRFERSRWRNQHCPKLCGQPFSHRKATQGLPRQHTRARGTDAKIQTRKKRGRVRSDHQPIRMAGLRGAQTSVVSFGRCFVMNQESRPFCQAGMGCRRRVWPANRDLSRAREQEAHQQEAQKRSCVEAPGPCSAGRPPPKSSLPVGTWHRSLFVSRGLALKNWAQYLRCANYLGRARELQPDVGR